MVKGTRWLLILALFLWAAPLGAGNFEEIETFWNPLTPRDHRASYTEGTTVVPIPPEKVAKVLVEELDHWSETIPRLLYSRVVSKEKAKEITALLKPIDFEEVLEIVGDEDLPLSKRIYPVGTGRSVNYLLQYMDYPWPVGNKWILFQEEDTVDPVRHTFHRRYQMMVGQLARAEGEWHVRADPDRPGWSIATYTIVGDAGFQVPRFIAKIICTGQARVVLEALQLKANQLAQGISQ